MDCVIGHKTTLGNPIMHLLWSYGEELVRPPPIGDNNVPMYFGVMSKAQRIVCLFPYNFKPVLDIWPKLSPSVRKEGVASPSSQF